jgi:hypothetical protein
VCVFLSVLFVCAFQCYLYGYFPSRGERLQFAKEKLANAQTRENIEDVYRAVHQINHILGNQLGMPETPQEYRKISPDLPLFPENATRDGFETYRIRLEKDAWWRDFPTSKECPDVLRTVASVVNGCLNSVKADCANSDLLLSIAIEAGNYLLYAQKEAGNGVFPIPDLRGKGGKFDEMVTEFLSEAEKNNKLDEVMHNGWIIEDLQEGHLFFDHGLCAFAITELYEATGDPIYLDSILWAEQWLSDRPSVPNWNYNSFPILFLCKLARITSEPSYFDKAIKRFHFGILPGQLVDGEKQGKWNDPHNALWVYHMIIVRSMLEMQETLELFPESLQQDQRERFEESFYNAFDVLLDAMKENGITHPDILCECLSRVILSEQSFSLYQNDSRFQSLYQSISRFVYERDLQGKPYLSPASRGYFLRAMKVIRNRK